ncbi:hypothetical protein FIBSPDRAFT_878232 [Athelia psychrophila]|uniref:Uncharacterized protein n=1 Tax=Athelia psychrophila TaxID=1759441 RepID=A0A167V6Y8_9AGAM|nr:hypothetical protein FIBSPDRAFT_879528 [Fibularhizoctonia sp. CBS 109695]KZP04703.1 hypothetical protein FIBSPDRAFT_878232 [Fibularhizoctonia sp. CBS 109695]
MVELVAPDPDKATFLESIPAEHSKTGRKLLGIVTLDALGSVPGLGDFEGDW